MAKFPASGALFNNSKKRDDTPKHPDYTGNLELEHEHVRDLVAQMKEGVEHPRLDMACWRKESKRGTPFLSLRANIMSDRREGGGYTPSQAPKGYRKPTVDAVGASQKVDLDDEIPF